MRGPFVGCEQEMVSAVALPHLQCQEEMLEGALAELRPASESNPLQRFVAQLRRTVDIAFRKTAIPAKPEIVRNFTSIGCSIGRNCRKIAP